MAKIVVIGATGNVGMATLHALRERLPVGVNILAGVRQVRPQLIPPELKVTPLHFDLTAAETYGPVLAQADSLFLLPLPGVTNGVKHFERLMEEAKEQEIKHVVYLSVQGADGASFIPHHKIEK